jgi:hypothetical protein
MASEYFSYNDIIWHYDYAPIDDFRDLRTPIRKYGLVNAGRDKWAVVEDDHSTPYKCTKTLTTVTGRQTAFGFIKLLMEK